jgi:hypothetical protein
MGEMTGGLAFSLAPMVGGFLYSGSPWLPFVTGGIAGLSLIPLLLRTQRSVHRQAGGPIVGGAPEVA